MDNAAYVSDAIGSYGSNYALQHHGIKGQKWGMRRYQNTDGSLTAEGRARYGYGTTAYGISNNTGHRKAAKDALKAESKLEKRYNKAVKKSDPKLIKETKKELDTFRSNKNKTYKELGMSTKEIKFRDIEAKYNRRLTRALVAGWALAGPAGGITGVAISTFTSKGRAYEEAYGTARTDYNQEKNRGVNKVHLI